MAESIKCTNQREYCARWRTSKPNRQNRKVYTTAVARQNKVKHLVIGSEYQSVGEKACMNITKIHRLELAAPVMSIGESAFRGCTQLVSVNMSEGHPVKNFQALPGFEAYRAARVPRGYRRECLY